MKTSAIDMPLDHRAYFLRQAAFHRQRAARHRDNGNLEAAEWCEDLARRYEVNAVQVVRRKRKHGF